MFPSLYAATAHLIHLINLTPPNHDDLICLLSNLLSKLCSCLVEHKADTLSEYLNVHCFLKSLTLLDEQKDIISRIEVIFGIFKWNWILSLSTLDYLSRHANDKRRCKFCLDKVDAQVLCLLFALLH